MSDKDHQTTPGISFWVIGIVALIWNLLGVVNYLISVMTGPEALGALPEAERALYTNVPVSVTSAFAVAVWVGTIACVLLLLRKSLAVPLFAVSLIAGVFQIGHALFVSKMIAVLGVSAAILPIVVVVVAAFLFWFSISAKRRGWIG